MSRYASLMLITILAVITSTVTITAQDDTCPQLVEQAYSTAAAACNSVGRDQACYGNLTISAGFQPNVVETVFENPGDSVNLSDIQSLRLSPMNMVTAEWGVSLLYLQANLPDEDPTRNVELVLFGNVTIEQPEQRPARFGPMQAFYFESGREDRPCEAAPDSGILIQTPEGVGEITLLVNEVVIELGSTVFMQAQPSNAMAIYVVEGESRATAFDTTVTAPAGTQVQVPLDSDGIASGPPAPPAPYDEIPLQTLPLVLLQRQITIAPPLSPQGEQSQPVLPPNLHLQYVNLAESYEQGTIHHPEYDCTWTYTFDMVRVEGEIGYIHASHVGEGDCRASRIYIAMVNIYTGEYLGAEDLPKVQVTASAVRVRTEPGTAGGDSTIIRSAENGEVFERRSEIESVRADGYTWIPIIIDGQDGWVALEGFVQEMAVEELSPAPISHYFKGAGYCGGNEVYSSPGTNNRYWQASSTDTHDCATGIRISAEVVEQQYSGDNQPTAWSYQTTVTLVESNLSTAQPQD